MTDPLDPVADGRTSAVELDKDNLKHWLCELTHLSAQQVEQVMAQREQELLSHALKQQLK